MSNTLMRRAIDEQKDEQVYHRFCAHRCFGKLAGVEFKKTVAIWDEKVLKLPVSSNLTSSAMIYILVKATFSLFC